MKELYPRFRITVELLEDPLNGKRPETKLTAYMWDRNQIAGDVWLTSGTPRHSFDVNSAEVVVSLGRDGLNIRSVQELIARERERK